MNCPEQADCKDYKWEHKIRSHHVREKEKCLHWDGNYCKLLQGQSCNIEKIKKIREEQK